MLPFLHSPLWFRVAVAAFLIGSVTVVPIAILAGLAYAELQRWQPPVWNIRGLGW